MESRGILIGSEHVEVDFLIKLDLSIYGAKIESNNTCGARQWKS